MAREKKDFKALNCKLDSSIWDALDQYCTDTGSNKTFVVEKALMLYLDKQKEQQAILRQFNKTSNK